MTHRRLVLVLGLATMISTASPSQGQLFPELRTYSDNNVETVTCPRSCSRDGDSVAFCIFDNATSIPRRLYSYLSENDLLVDKPGNDCDDRTSGNGTAFISFRVQPRMSGCTIYCVRRLRHCSSLINTLIPPLLINVEAENRCSNSPTLSPTPSLTLISSTTSLTSISPLTSTSPLTATSPLTSTSPLASTSPATPTSTPTPATQETSIPPATQETSAENLSSENPSSLLSTPSFSSMPNLTPAMTGGIAVGAFIAGLLLGVTCGIPIAIIVKRKRDKSAVTASTQELDTT